MSFLSDTLIQTGNSVLRKHKNNLNIKEGDSDLGSDLNQTSTLCDDDQIIKGRCVSNTSAASSLSPWYSSASVELRSTENIDIDRQGISESDKNCEDVGRNNQWQQWNRHDVHGKNVKEGGNAAEEKATLTAQRTDRANRQEDSQKSAEGAGDTKHSETETKDGTDGIGTGRVQNRGELTPQMPKTQTSNDIEKRNTLQVINPGDTEPALAACEPLHCSPVKTDCEDLCHDDATTFTQDLLHQVIENNLKERPAETLATIPTYTSEPLNETHVCLSQTNITAISAEANSAHVLEKTAIQTGPYLNPSDMNPNMKLTAEMYPMHESQDCPFVNTEAEPQTQEFSELPPGQLRYLIGDENIENGSGQGSMINEKEDDAGGAGMTETNIFPDNKNDAAAEMGSTKCSEQFAAKEKLVERHLPSHNTYRMNWSSAQSGALSRREMSSSSVLHQMAQVLTLNCVCTVMHTTYINTHLITAVFPPEHRESWWISGKSVCHITNYPEKAT